MLGFAASSTQPTPAGKGAKDRIVPINDRLAAAIDDWQTVVDGGYIARSISKGGVVGDSLSGVVTMGTIAKCIF